MCKGITADQNTQLVQWTESNKGNRFSRKELLTYLITIDAGNSCFYEALYKSKVRSWKSVRKMYKSTLVGTEPTVEHTSVMVGLISGARYSKIYKAEMLRRTANAGYRKSMFYRAVEASTRRAFTKGELLMLLDVCVNLKGGV